MAVTKETVSSKIQELAKNSIHAAVLEGKEDFELYNALVGTTFDAQSYDKVAGDAPEYLLNHIPGGSKLIVKEETEEGESKDEEKPKQTEKQSKAAQVKTELENNETKTASEIVSQVQYELDEQISHIGDDATSYAEYDLNYDGVIDEVDKNIAYSQVDVNGDGEFGEDDVHSSYIGE